MFEIVRSNYESDINVDFVAIGNLIDNNFESTHSAFLIKYDETIYVFHYTGWEIEFKSQQADDDYYHKITETITPDEIPAFLAYAKTIKKYANPIYGYFYSGEYYDLNGEHFGDKNLGERMTCVGFCLNVLKGFLEEDYILHTDWSEESHNDSDYLEKYCAEHNIELSLIQSSHRRITPRECLTSCFFKELPIRKTQIDNNINQVNNHFSQLYQRTNN